MSQAPIAVSMGDPAGIGLEITARAVRERAGALPRFFVIGDADALARAAGSTPIERIEVPQQAEADATLYVLHRPLAARETPGAPDPRNAAAITGAIEEGVRLQQRGAARGLVTLPIAKSVLYAAGFAHPGHTEFLAELVRRPGAPAPSPIMMLVAEGLRVALASVHVPLTEVAGRLSVGRVAHAGRVTAAALRRDFGIARPRLALAGLNPHAGEAGTIGREEIEIINPAAALLRAEGWDVTDALPADTLFHPEARAGYDAAIAMYHDQGLIPIKTLDFWGGVNVTLGLEIIRTSPDHGTGFDIAGKGVARADSFVAALRLAAAMADARAGAG